MRPIRAALARAVNCSAAVELRRLFPGITDTAQAPAFARTIAGWVLLLVGGAHVPDQHVRKTSPNGFPYSASFRHQLSYTLGA
jgi:hypothetical protein